jgi:hypothetical protein
MEFIDMIFYFVYFLIRFKKYNTNMSPILDYRIVVTNKISFEMLISPGLGISCTTFYYKIYQI